VKFPDQIPERLRDSALFLPELDENEGAWFKKDAVAVIESLDGTSVPISDVKILNMTPRGYVLSDPALSVHRFPNEADSDYSVRSHSLALVFIRKCETVDDKTLFVLTFPLWKDAA
jgi:hypothetical protein